MKDRRLELDAKLREILGSNNVYFDPPESVRIRYPAIIYARNNLRARKADNTVYTLNTEYTITLIDRTPISEFLDPLVRLPYCTHERHYVADNLHHDVFVIYV